MCGGLFKRLNCKSDVDVNAVDVDSVPSVPSVKTVSPAAELTAWTPPEEKREFELKVCSVPQSVAHVCSGDFI